MALVTTEAFVVQAIRYGETSMIYRLFTRDRGVVPVIAKGVRRPKSRFGARMDPFHRLDVTYYDKPSREIQTLSRADLVADYPGVIGSLERMEAAGAWFRFLRRVVPEHAPAEPLFTLAAAALRRLEAVEIRAIPRWSTYHRLAAVRTLGLAPMVDACAGCGAALPDSEGMGFSVEEGGAVCSRCAGGAAGRLGRDEYGLLVVFDHPDWSLVDALGSGARGEARVRERLDRFVAWHADARPAGAGSA